MRSEDGTTRILLVLLILLPLFKTIDVTTTNQRLSATDSTDINNRAGTSEISTENPVPNHSDLMTVTTSLSSTSPVYNIECGNHRGLPAKSSWECDPTGNRPCCGRYNWCGNTPSYCTCEDCVDYRVVQDLRASDTNCAITRVGDFLKTVCSDKDDKTEYYFKCISSDVSYNMHNEFITYDIGVVSVSKVCDNDKYAYQACFYRSDIRKNYKTGEALCGGYHCTDKENKIRFIPCDGNCTDNKVCPTDVSDSKPPTTCNNLFDTKYYCRDESDCNGYRYGINCLMDGDPLYVPV